MILFHYNSIWKAKKMANSVLSDVSQVFKMDINSEKDWIKGYCNEVKDFLQHEKVNEMKQYYHHNMIDCHFHSVFVSYITYKVCVKLNCNVHETTVAALLHDFYLYDWHVTKHDELHAWYHPKAAVINAEKYFGKLTELQRDMMLSHMWPLHIVPPKSKEGMILTFADKYCTNFDLIGASDKFLPIYNEIISEVQKT